MKRIQVSLTHKDIWSVLEREEISSQMVYWLYRPKGQVRNPQAAHLDRSRSLQIPTEALKDCFSKPFLPSKIQLLYMCVSLLLFLKILLYLWVYYKSWGLNEPTFLSKGSSTSWTSVSFGSHFFPHFLFWFFFLCLEATNSVCPHNVVTNTVISLLLFVIYLITHKSLN